MIAIKALTKTIGIAPALSTTDLFVARGEGIALTGSDLTGRRALMQILATLVPPSSGTLVIGDLDAVRDVYRVRRLIAYADAADVRANRLRVSEYVRAVAQARRQPASSATEAIEAVGLDAAASIESLPDALRRRVPVAAAFSAGAELLLLDRVMDLFSERELQVVRQWLIRARDRGTTVIVNTSDGIDMTEICQRTIRVESGRLSETTPAPSGALLRQLVSV